MRALGTAAKHAMLELEVSEDIGITASVATERHARCLIAFAQHDRDPCGRSSSRQ
ncbi:hypothetical protein ABZ622_39540 [Streptomyces sp. NPDC007164]|uniref:hypothetical protein n=1 Tax=Streptomyces sp. NPDC007164 TaxID=3156918 RepID=UPI0033C5CB21